MSFSLKNFDVVVLISQMFDLAICWEVIYTVELILTWQGDNLIYQLPIRAIDKLDELIFTAIFKACQSNKLASDMDLICTTSAKV